MPDKRREGSVSISGVGSNATEISCEQANGEFPARKDMHVIDGVDGRSVVSSSKAYPKAVDDTSYNPNPAAYLSAKQSFCNRAHPQFPSQLHVGLDSRTTSSSSESHRRGASSKLDESRTPSQVARDHRGRPRTDNQEAQSGPTLRIPDLASSVEPGQGSQGPVAEVRGGEAQVEQRGQHDHPATRAGRAEEDLRDFQAASDRPYGLREVQLQELRTGHGGGLGILRVGKEDGLRGTGSVRPEAVPLHALARDGGSGRADPREEPVCQVQGTVEVHQ